MQRYYIMSTERNDCCAEVSSTPLRTEAYSATYLPEILCHTYRNVFYLRSLYELKICQY